MPHDRWSPSEAAKCANELDLLVYRSNLLGQDVTIVNRGGGNTSVKRIVLDHRGEPVRVLTVKASGFDLRTITRAGFVDVRLDDAQRTRQRETMSDEEMVAYLARCLLDPEAPRPSIETLLHAFLPFTHIDHTHADAPLALCTVEDGEARVRDLFGAEALWFPYVRPGFLMAKRIADMVAAHPEARAVFLQKHGLLTWGETSEECYRADLEFIGRCEEYVASRARGRRVFGGLTREPLSPGQRREVALRYLPALRGALSVPRDHGDGSQRVVLRYDDSPPVLEFVGSREGRELAAQGLACPDHVLYTKVWPLWVDWDPAHGPEALIEATRQGLARYEVEYRQFFERNRAPGDPMQEPRPRIVLVPGLGMVTAGKDLRAATITAEFYHRAIAIMAGASAVGRFTSLTEKEAYDIEYWPLELYKLTLLPPERELARRVALITGAAGALGRAIAQRFVEAGAHVLLADLNADAVGELAQALNERYGPGVATPTAMDVADPASVAAALERGILAYGGLDIVVLSAGYATARPLEELPLEEWQRTYDILTTGSFLVARDAIRVLRQQRRLDGRPLGGSIVSIASKAGLAAAKEAAAYASAKAAVLHLARCLAEEVGEDGIRVNSLAPDAIIAGSGLWAGQWGQARARAHGVSVDELAEVYRQRNALKVNITAEDVAEAALFFASDRSAKITGAVLTVDGGLRDAYVR